MTTILEKPAYVLLFLFAATFMSCQKESDDSADTGSPVQLQDELLRVNQIQLIASHNSYRQMTTDTVFSFLLSVAQQVALPPEYDPTALDYDHAHPQIQMEDYGVRGLELDIYYDPTGGTFADRHVLSLLGLPTASGIPALNQPGLKILHIKDVDYNSHFNTFQEGLQAIKNGSLAHPGHLPLFINVESKSSSPGDDPTLSQLGFTPAPSWDATAADLLDSDIRSVFGNGLTGIFTPDMLKDTFPTLEAAALAGQWPKLKNVRGKVFFILEGDAVQHYVQSHPSLQGRAMFIYGAPSNAETAFVIKNDARADSAQIRVLVSQGYMVRTRCDAGTTEARTGDYSGKEAAMGSGAHILSTDYYRPDSRAGQIGWSDYSVRFTKGSIGRKNPVTASGIDVGEDLND